MNLTIINITICMWLFFKVKKLIQTHFTFSILKHRKQMHKRRVQFLDSRQRIWVYFSLIPLFIFFEKAKTANPYDRNRSKSFLIFKPSINVPKRVERKYIRKSVDQNNYIFSVSCRLINKKKKEVTSFFSIKTKYLNKTVCSNHLIIVKKKTLSSFRSNVALREFSCWELGYSPKKKKNGKQYFRKTFEIVDLSYPDNGVLKKGLFS